jgi:sec-independent protein translocase protein TatA
MLGNLNGWHLIIILAIVLLLFGAPKLPALARSLGQSMKIFKSEIKDPEAEQRKADAAAAEAAAARPTAPPAPAAPAAEDITRTTSVNPADPNTKP